MYKQRLARKYLFHIFAKQNKAKILEKHSKKFIKTVDTRGSV